jgi:hypothetical protein
VSINIPKINENWNSKSKKKKRSKSKTKVLTEQSPLALEFFSPKNLPNITTISKFFKDPSQSSTTVMKKK